MGYQEALEHAGAEVLEFAEFGDYQGTWYAVVNNKGSIYLISGSYGSCSGCDSFQAEMGYHDDESPKYKKKLAEFGEAYLDDQHDIDKEIEQQEERKSWDMGSESTVDFLKRIKKEYKLEGNNAN